MDVNEKGGKRHYTFFYESNVILNSEATFLGWVELWGKIFYF
jgi:hypothetical protein